MEWFTQVNRRVKAVTVYLIGGGVVFVVSLVAAIVLDGIRND